MFTTEEEMKNTGEREQTEKKKVQSKSNEYFFFLYLFTLVHRKIISKSRHLLYKVKVIFMFFIHMDQIFDETW